MDKAWIKIISVTGAVGVIGYLFSLFMLNFFSDSVLSQLGSEKVFYVIVLLVSVLAIALILAILKPKEQQKNPSSGEKNISVSYKDSTHKGNNTF